MSDSPVDSSVVSIAGVGAHIPAPARTLRRAARDPAICI